MEDLLLELLSERHLLRRARVEEHAHLVDDALHFRPRPHSVRHLFAFNVVPGREEAVRRRAPQR